MKFTRWISFLPGPRLLGVGAFGLLVTLLMVWLAGGFRHKLQPGSASHAPVAAANGEIVEVRARMLPRVETAVGAIQPVHRVDIAARILARILEMNAVAGQKVKAGDVLVRLDDADLRSRVKQAQAALDEAGAAMNQARIEESRTRALFDQQRATSIEMDRSATALKSAQAAVDRSTQALDEARTTLAFATLASPIDGIVVDKRASAGDTATPGQVLVALLDPTRMQLVAPVREALSRRLKVGQPVDVSIEILDHPCTGTISEIVPEADAASRSFAVKVTGPCPEGVLAGMFGRLLVPLDAEQVLTIPRNAVRSVGQLELATVRSPAGDQRRTLRIGRTLGEDVEILAGLAAGEKVVVPAAPAE